MDLQVIDNFLEDYLFKSLQTVLMGDGFPWYYNEGILTEDHPSYDSNQFQFTHTFYDKRPPWNGISSSAYDMMEYVLSKLRVRELYKIKANLNPKTIFHRTGGYHIDDKNMTTAVFYINTCNGYTKFKEGSKVKSVANRMVIFDSNLEHQGVTCTDEKRRVVINFNYE